nr:hypothetical protein KXZ65_11350 [Pectobacterium sp. PL152]
MAELNRFLTVFDEGEQADTARKELSRQQGILADPVYQGGCTHWRKLKMAAAIPPHLAS